MLIFHPIEAFKIADKDYGSDAALFKAMGIAGFWVILVVAIIGLTASIISAEIGYGDWHCAFADCKRIYIQSKP